LDGGLAALLTIVAGILGWLGKWVLDVSRQRGEARRVARKDAVDEVWKYVAELKAQNERQQAVIEQHGRAVEAFSRENAEYREEAAELRQCVHFLYDHIKRAFATLKHDCGQDPGELPELPAARPRPAPGGVEFLGKQAAQSAQLLREAATSIQPPGGGPPP
jgi:hypothetical protein